jgi:hypothetical protein
MFSKPLSYRASIFLALVAVFITFVSATLQSRLTRRVSELRATPNITNWGGTPRSPESEFPGILTCAQIPDVTGEGLSWRGLTIGRSTLADVQAEVDDHGIWDTKFGNFHFPAARDPEDNALLGLETCFTGTVLKALNTTSLAGFPPNLAEWVKVYGEPDLVTWDRDYFSRSLVWSSEGLLAVIYVPTEETLNIVLFPPLSYRDPASSWLGEALPQTGPTSSEGIDLDPLPPDQDVEDPWGFTE